MATKIEIYGVIGWDVEASAVVAEIEAAEGDDIAVHINSGGGSVDEALAIYNRLVGHEGKVSVFIDALAASAATLIALAGDVVTMPDNATMMVHLPWHEVAGTAEELRKTAGLLDATAEKMTQMYAQKTGIAIDEMREMLSSELWMTAAEAQELGFVDFVTSPVRSADQNKRSAAALYLGRASAERLPTYAHPPGWVPKETRKSQASAPRRAADLIDTTRGNTKQEPVMAENSETPAANEPKAMEDAEEMQVLVEELTARIEELEAEKAELEAALEANREEVDEQAAEKEAVAASAAEEIKRLKARAEKLENENVRKDLLASGVDPEHHDDLVELKRVNASLYQASVKRLANEDGVQARLSATGPDTVGSSNEPSEILARAKAAGVEYGSGLAVWLAKNHPDKREEVTALARAEFQASVH